MDNFYVMAKIQAELFIFLLIGVFAHKRRIISKEGRQCLIDFLIKIALPCMIFESFNQSIGFEQLQSASFILGMSFVVCFFSMLLGKLIWRWQTPQQSSVLKYGTLISNAGFAGLPLVEKAYSGLGLFYASVFIIPSRIFMWSSGISLFTQADRKTRIKSVLLNPGIIAVFLGIVRMLLQIPLPDIFDTALKSVGNCTMPISMIIVGTILGDIPLKAAWNRNAFALAGVRLVLIPGLLLLILKVLKMDVVSTAAAVTLTGMPVGATTSLLAEKYGADYEFASECVFVSTILSMVTVPLLSIFL